ncbi:MAG TPA: hypothetical protein DIT93_08515 [Pelagibacterium sp.]|nr:hypothetical protein [Pelagibacterium sp.]
MSSTRSGIETVLRFGHATKHEVRADPGCTGVKTRSWSPLSDGFVFLGLASQQEVPDLCG